MFQTKTLSASRVEEFVARYNEGKATLASIAGEIGCSVPTAGRLLKRNGATMRSKGRPKGSKTVNRHKSKVNPTVAATEATPISSTVETPTDEKLAASPVESTPDFLAFQQRVVNFNNS